MPDKKKIFFNGIDYVPPEPSKLDERFLVQYKPVLDPKTGETKIDGSDKLDLVELIQSYKDQCGMEFMMKQVKLGVVSIESLADDGQHSGDASGPMDVNDAYRQSLVAKDANDKLAGALGLKPDELTEENIRAKLAEILGKVDGAKPEMKEVEKHE